MRVVLISSRSSQKTFDVDWHGVTEVGRENEEKRSREAWSWRVRGESRTGRKTRSVESEVVVYSTRSSLAVIKHAATKIVRTYLLKA